MSHFEAKAQADLHLVILTEPIHRHCPQRCRYRSVVCLINLWYLSTFGSVICFYC